MPHPSRLTLLPQHLGRLRVRKLTVRYIWDAAVDALTDGNPAPWKTSGTDVMAELDSDWGAYTYVSHIGLGA